MADAQLNASVAVLLPCRNESAHIEACLLSILHQEPVPGGVEVWVIDGASDDDTATKIRAVQALHANVHLLTNPQQIVATALNLGIAHSRAPYVCRMDAHSAYAKDYVRTCLAVAQHTQADNVGGAARTRASGVWQQAIAVAYHSRFSTGGARFHQPDYEGDVDTVTYGFWPRTTFTKVGVFDETLVRNQDDEHNLRIRRAGGRIYQSPRIVSWYAPRASLRDLYRQYEQYGYWKVRVWQKHRVPGSWRELVPGVSLLAGACLAACALWWAWAARLLGVLAALYALLLLVASVRASAGARPLLVRLPWVFATYHLSYGVGWLRGLWDFVLLRRSPRAALTRLTRSSGA